MPTPSVRIADSKDPEVRQKWLDYCVPLHAGMAPILTRCSSLGIRPDTGKQIFCSLPHGHPGLHVCWTASADRPLELRDPFAYWVREL